jgi:phosphoribosylpyrophosphate synthetase
MASSAQDLIRSGRAYQIISHPAQEALAHKLVDYDSKKFTFHPTKWCKFKDGTDNIEVGGFYPQNKIRGQNVIFLASFHDNDSTLSQFHVLEMLCESFVESMTVVLPYYPTGTMERVVQEGQVATANTLARLLSNLPRVGKPVRVMTYDLHTLQNRFYLSGNALATLHTATPLLCKALNNPSTYCGKRGTQPINCLAFPDEGACKRFKCLFEPEFPNWPVITCGKVRDGETRIVKIQDFEPKGLTGKIRWQDGIFSEDGTSNPKDLHCIIIDDLVQTGGTLVECAKAIRAAGASSVSAFVTHAVFPGDCWGRFMNQSDGQNGPFEHFFITNSNPRYSISLLN